jgi:hypothetical protein
MANDIALFTPQSRPEYALAKQEPSALTKSLQGGSGYAGKRISIKAGVFRLISDGKEIASIEERFLDVVFVRAAEHIGRTYYSETYNEDTPSAPVCWSADGTTPDKTASAPQATQCASCPQNIKGSGKEDSRACRFSQRVAVVLANDIEGDVLQLSIPAASLFGKEEGGNLPLQAYARLLAAQNSNMEQFITRLKFDVKASSPKLFFKPMRWLTSEEYAVAQEKGKTPEAVQAVVMTVAQMDKVVMVVPPAAKPVLKAAAPAPVAPAEDDEPPAPAPTVGQKKRGRPAGSTNKGNGEAPAPEPTIRTAPKAPEMPARATAASVAAGWDTDD